MTSVLTVALAFLLRGWKVIPIPFRSKAPVIEGWNQLRLTEAEVREYFRGQVNIGVLLGEPSGWLIDIDLDHPRCVALADQFLPPTPAVFGRPGKPRSHRIYRATRPVATKKHKSRSAGMLVELRSTGSQTVFPPSTHETGQSIEWEVDGAEPSSIDPDELLDAVKRLADTVRIELGEKAAPKPKKPTKPEPASPCAADTGAPACASAAEASPEDVRVERCLRAMLQMRIVDSKDGSSRLFAAACRCVEHDLGDEAALLAIRRYCEERPFPTEWSDEQILARVRDAEKLCKRGIANRAEADRDQDNGTGRKTQAADLVELAQVAEFFHFEEEAFVSFEVSGHRETARVNSKPFRTWLSRRYYEENGKVAGGQAVQDALNTLYGQALFTGPELPVAVRAAECGGAYWIDLCDSDRQGVRIDCNGWTLVPSTQVPVRFVRRRAMLALPVPVSGGSLAELRDFLNVRDENDWVLVLAWLVAALRPFGPCPVLNVTGEQGSAKSTMCRLLRALVDPNKAPLRSEPRDARDLMIAARNAWLIALDNLSSLPAWLSDALCRLSTGGGFATRELFTDADEVVFDATRPVIVNGIESIVTRPDLLDRSVTLTLESIPEERRKTEAKLWADFGLVSPRILGALLIAVSVAMRRVNSIKLSATPRMADFAEWATAAEPGLGLPDGAFLRAYVQDRAAAHETALENSAVGRAIMALVTTNGRWTGTSTTLLEELNIGPWTTEAIRKSPEWPKTNRKLSGDLRRLAPCLRASGISVLIPSRRSGREKRRELVLEQMAAEHSAHSAQSAEGSPGAAGAETMRTVADYCHVADAHQRSASNPTAGSETPIADRADHADRCARESSNREEVIEL